MAHAKLAASTGLQPAPGTRPAWKVGLRLALRIHWEVVSYKVKTNTTNKLCLLTNRFPLLIAKLIFSSLTFFFPNRCTNFLVYAF